MKLRRGEPELKGDTPTSDTQWNCERLIARVNPNRAWVLDGERKSISGMENSISGPGKSGSAPAELNFRDPEIHCPLILGCPHLVNDLADDKPIASIKLSSQPAGRPAGPTNEEVKAYLLSHEALQLVQRHAYRQD